MEQLTGADSIFLSMESPEVLTHTGGLTILDPTGVPDFGFKRFRDFVKERVALAPRFQWILDEVPLGLDRPYWKADTAFDVDRHLHRIAVPQPGGMRELADLASHLFTGALLRDRPLWEMWWIEGLENGRVAMFAKIHHALMDGVSGSGLGELLCDLQPDAPARSDSIAQPTAPPEVPGDLQKATHALAQMLARPQKIAEVGAQILRDVVLRVTHANDPETPPLIRVPSTPFNARVGPRRSFACASVSLADVKQVKQRFDVTVNDVLLALVGSALREWLADLGELPEESLIALVPASTREDGDLSLGNKVTNMSVLWATDESDPHERLRLIHRNARYAKERLSESSFNPMDAVGDSVTPAAAGLMLRAWEATSEMVPALGNAVVSTVRGTPVPLYTAGARIECIYPMSILLPGQGLNVTAVSYMDRVDFGFTVDPDLVPDAWKLAERIPHALSELMSE